MGVIKNTLQKQINNNNLTKYSNTTAVILSYDIVTNTATIKFPDPNGDGFLRRENVTFANTLGAATGSGIYAGQTCTISFIGGNIWSPIITGLADNLYEAKTSSDQGAYIIGVDNDNIYTKPENISPMMNDWIDENNTNQNKYNNDLWDYTKSDTSQEVHEILQSLDKYTAEESGMTNLDTKSTVKLRENGDIDIFVSHNVGIRISNTDHKIYMYGLGLYLNNKELKNCQCLCYNNPNNNNSPDDTDDKIINEIENNLKLLEVNTEELEKCIARLKEIHGKLNRYKLLEDYIDEAKNIKVTYSAGNCTIKDITRMNNRILALIPIFESEIQDAQNVLNPILK